MAFMTPAVRRIYDEAKKNKEFQQALKDSGEKEYQPRFMWGETEKAIYATIYMGYLVALNKYDESNYKY